MREAASEAGGQREGSTRWARWAVPAAIAALGGGVWLWFALHTGFAMEDAFITYRYARNIAEGAGFVYNPGERVLGTTTPLQTLLLAGLGALLGSEHIPSISAVLMPIFGLAAGLLGYAAVVRLGASWVGAAAACLVLYLHPLMIRTSLGGMETPLVLFLMALSLYFVSRGQSVAATAAVGALALSRVDGLIWGGLVIGVTLLSRYRRPGRQAAAFAAIVLPWVLFALIYFGSPMPNSMAAKGVVRPGREATLLDATHMARLSRFYLSGTGVGSDRPLLAPWMLLLALGVYGAARARRREMLLLVVFPVVYAGAMYLGRAPMHYWYLPPMLLCCVLVAGVGVGQAVSWFRGWGARRRLKAAIAGAVAALCLWGVADAMLDLPRYVRHAKQFQENEVGLRQAAGEWLRGNTPREASVAMEAIGYQGYYSERRVVDMAGLVTPKVVEFKGSTGSNGAVFKRITRELRPDYIVLRSFEVDENRHFNGGKLFETDEDRRRFFESYREVKRFSAPHPKLAPLVSHLTVYGPRGSEPAGR